VTAPVLPWLGRTFQEASDEGIRRSQSRGSRVLWPFHLTNQLDGWVLVQAGVRPKDLQTILRHSKVTTTMDLHAYDADLRGAVASLDRALGS
jgi:hypothetical protein